MKIPEQKVLGKLMGSAYVDKLLACCHTVALDLHSYPYICVLLPQVDYEKQSKSKGVVRRVEFLGTINPKRSRSYFATQSPNLE
ncbi:hypothetical protein OIU78_028501, partial [Salix suchowensis]